MISIKTLFAALFILAIASCSTSGKTKSFSDSVDQTIEKNWGEFKKCHDFAIKHKLPKEPVPVGRIEMGFTVSPAGRVTESNILTTTVGNMVLEKCVQETLRRLEFPSNKEGRLTQTSYPFDFNLPEEPKK